MKNIIIGIAGKKNSGKDTVASMLNYMFVNGVKSNYKYWLLNRLTYDTIHKNKIMHFADPLKDILSIMYNINRAAFDNRDYKDKMWYNIGTNKFCSDDVISKMSNNKLVFIYGDILNNTSLHDIILRKGAENCFIKLRTLMQYFGTNVCRNNLQDDIWIKIAKTKMVAIAETYNHCIVPDVRFENEANAIRGMNESLYGVLIKVENISETTDATDTHISEQLLTNCDYTVKNNHEQFMPLFYQVFDVYCKLIKR